MIETPEHACKKTFICICWGWVCPGCSSCSGTCRRTSSNPKLEQREHLKESTRARLECISMLMRESERESVLAKWNLSLLVWRMTLSDLSSVHVCVSPPSRHFHASVLDLPFELVQSIFDIPTPKLPPTFCANEPERTVKEFFVLRAKGEQCLSSPMRCHVMPCASGCFTVYRCIWLRQWTGVDSNAPMHSCDLGCHAS